MKLYWSPRSCAIGIHILLEEAGARFETERLDLQSQEHKAAPFKTINPKSKVPTLVRDDGTVLTEFGAIATWIALTHPAQVLIPESIDDRVRSIEVMDYVVGTLHGQAFRRVLRPATFVPKDREPIPDAALDGIRAEGRTMAQDALAILDRQVGGGPYVCGESFSIGDAALFYAERWAPRADLTLPANLAAHLEHMRARPAVRRAQDFYGEA